MGVKARSIVPQARPAAAVGPAGVWGGPAAGIDGLPIGDRDRRSAPSTRKGAGRMDAMSLLKDDHDKVKKILGQLDSTTERGVKTREELFTKLKHELEIHEAIEEEIFYPALREHPKTKELTLEAYEEHHVVDAVMAEISGIPYDDETWGAKLTVMKENLEHHIEEEEGEMFDQARKVFDRAELVELGERMLARKQELTAAA
jgi:hypothetical protein